VIALIDYHAGNLTSVKKALAAVGAAVFVPQHPSDLAAAAGIIVPGVGHFQSTSALDRPWVDAVVSAVSDGRPLLGICLGMQWLYESSDEAPDLKGIGLLAGRCTRLGSVRLQPEVKVPHVGWNALALRTQNAWITEGVPDQAQVYFTHSYVAPVTSDTTAIAEHGVPFAAVVERGHVAGVQFHPEKSGDVGLTMLRNFVRRVG
jgi:glutamine amidotransferase